MGILMWILFGALVGWIANMITKDSRGGLIRNIIIGLLGAVIGGYLGSAFGFGSVTAFTLEGFLIATGGAVVLIWLLRMLRL